MRDLVDREKVLKGKVIYYSADGAEVIEGEAVPVEYIESLPNESTNEERRKGTWIYDADKENWECSECHTRHYCMTSLCPDCGSDMRPVKKSYNEDDKEVYQIKEG